MLHPTVLPLKSVRNPRDLGGYRGLNGRRILPHRLLRTGRINQISAADRQYLQQINLRKVIDLRTSDESQATPDPEFANVVHEHISISGREVGQVSQKIIAIHQKYQTDQYAGFKNMCLNYRDFVEQPHSLTALHNFFESLAATPHGAVLYHCSEGKDRTGICTVFLLHILGVDPVIIREDYLYSNTMLQTYRQELLQQHSQAGMKLRATMRSLASVANEYLDTALISIHERYGSLDAFLTQAVGLSTELRTTLQALYLSKD